VSRPPEPSDITVEDLEKPTNSVTESRQSDVIGEPPSVTAPPDN